MKKISKSISLLWLALAVVAMICVIVFSVLTGVTVNVKNASVLPAVELEDTCVSYQENDTHIVVADETGMIRCYGKEEDTPLKWSFIKPLSTTGTQGKVVQLALYGADVFALFDDRTVLRFAAEGSGEPSGVLETNYVPKRFAFSEEGGTLFAVYGEVGAKREVYLLRTDFGGSMEEPVSYRSYPKLDGGDYAVSSGGIEKGVQGILVTNDERVIIASDAYSVRIFNADGMESGYTEISIAAEKLGAICQTEEGFAGVDLSGNYYNYDAEFQQTRIIRGKETYTSVTYADGMFYGITGTGITGIGSDGSRMFSVNTNGETLVGISSEGFYLAGKDALRYMTVELAAQADIFGNLLPVFVPLLVVAVLFLCYASLNVWKPLGMQVNGAIVNVGKIFVKHRVAYLGLIPTFALLAVFYYWPIFSGFALSFFNYNGVTSEFVGFQNFIDVLHNTLFWDSTVTMLILLVTDIIKAIIPPLLFAEFILAVRNKQFSFVVRVLLFIPGILPGVAGTLVWVNGIFGSDSYGLLNSICSLFVPNFVQTWIGPYLEARSLTAIIMFAFPWVGSYLIFYGGIMSIPKSLFEAADLDGCGWWRRLVMIDLPLIFAQIKYIFITSFIASVQDYGRLFITDQATGHGLKVPALIIYENIYKGGSEPNYGLSSAMSMYLFVFLLVATILNFRKQNKEAAE